MRHFCLALSIALAVPGSTLAQTPDAAAESADHTAVARVLAQYRAAIERLDATGTEALFAEDSEVFENGGIEGSYANYLAHHLGPELGHFRSFRFTDHRQTVRVEGDWALATETYGYRIERHEGEPIVRTGVTTSVLRRDGASWRIISMHGSSRAPRPASTTR